MCTQNREEPDVCGLLASDLLSLALLVLTLSLLLTATDLCDWIDGL
jgi:hypothetical protein